MQNQPFAELWASSNFSFLHGASHPEEMVQSAATLGYRAISLTDQNTFAGIVRAHRAAKISNIQLIVGTQVQVRLTSHSEPISFLLHPFSRRGYGALCRLLTILKTEASNPENILAFDTFVHHISECSITLIPPTFSYDESHQTRLAFLKSVAEIVPALPDKKLVSIAFSKLYSHQAARHSEFIVLLSQQYGIPLLASNSALFHAPERKIMQDVLTCIRHKTSVKEAGFLLEQNAERYLKERKELYRLFQDYPRSITRGLELSEICSQFSLEQLRYEYPQEVTPKDETPLSYLTKLTWQGALERYQNQIPTAVQATIKEELLLIEELQYEKYFLTCYDIVQFARSKNILCQGRGAAANSAVCYCLGITAVDPARINLLFARFISKERQEPPDIDIDFEHERREEVIQYIYQRYGRERAALTCEIVTYRDRSAVRDVGKTLGLPIEVVTKLAKSIHRWNDCEICDDDLAALGLNPQDITIRNTISLSKELCSFPRHISQHVGGFIISQEPLCEIVPIRNASMPGRTIIEWDKDDIEALGMLKIDILALGMLSCIRRTVDLVNQRRLQLGESALELHSIPAEDSEVYDMICEADTVGVFQIESRAQMSMLPRLRPRCFYDLVIEVAIVRPGPIQGNMVHPYLKRRSGLEKVHYPDKRVEEILGKTLGVPLFQEQAMRLAITLAQFSPGEAEQLRRAMAAWKHNKEVIATFTRRVVEGMMQNGYSEEFALHCMAQIKGFSEYGFPESHAASFALLVYVSAWLKRHYPAEFTAALLNSQPMGFYAPAQIIRDAVAPPFIKRIAIEVRAIDIMKSSWECGIERDSSGSLSSVRLGMRLVKGLAEKEGRLIEELARKLPPPFTLQEFWNASLATNAPVRKASLITLARADALKELIKGDRHQALWQVRALASEPILRRVINRQPTSQLPLLSKQESMFKDYQQLGFSLDAHPLEFLRPALKQRGVRTSQELRALPSSRHKQIVTIAGIAIVRQRPGTAKGVVFLTLEDETGVSNAMIRPAIYELYRSLIISSSVLQIRGAFERVASVIYIQAQQVSSLDEMLKEIAPGVFPSRSYSY